LGSNGEKITFTLSCPEIQALCFSDSDLSKVIKRCGDLTYSLHTDAFSFLIETIVGQMLSNRAADAITRRLYSLCGGNVSIKSIMNLDHSSIKGIGLSAQKTEYIKSFGNFVYEHPNYFEELNELADADVINRLTRLRGIGPWSAKMYLIFVLNRLNILPYEDGAFLQAYKWLYNTENIK